MSLLTDEDIFRVHPWMAQPAGNELDNDLGTHRATADASQTKTLKAVAEWLNGKCSNEHHSGRGHWQRKNCVNCRMELIEAAAEGKMPGEAD